jgi:hypothetical protein
MTNAWYAKKPASKELVPVDDVVAALPFIVRRDHRIVAAFAKKTLARSTRRCGRGMMSPCSVCIPPPR